MWAQLDGALPEEAPRPFFQKVNRMSFYFEKLVCANYRFERM